MPAPDAVDGEDEAWLKDIGEEWRGDKEEPLKKQVVDARLWRNVPEDTQQRFLDSVKLLRGQKRFWRNCPWDVQRQLFSWRARAVRGEPPDMPPQDLDQDLWEAWREVAGLSVEDAMQAYVTAVDQIYVDARVAAEVARPSRGNDIFAAARAEKSLARLLPEHRDAKDEDGLILVHHAVDAEQLPLGKKLLEARADTARADDTGSTPLHVAALLGAAEAAKLLVAPGAPLAARDEDGSCPADSADTHGAGRAPCSSIPSTPASCRRPTSSASWRRRPPKAAWAPASERQPRSSSPRSFQPASAGRPPATA